MPKVTSTLSDRPRRVARLPARYRLSPSLSANAPPPSPSRHLSGFQRRGVLSTSDARPEGINTTRSSFELDRGHLRNENVNSASSANTGMSKALNAINIHVFIPANSALPS